MKICKKGFVYKVAYVLSSKPPERTNLCRLFWRFILFFFVVWPLVVTLITIITITQLICAPFLFLFTRRPIFFGFFERELRISVPFKKWPKIFGKRVWPIVPLSIAGLIYLISLMSAATWKSTGVYSLWILGGAVAILITMFLVMIIVELLKGTRKSESWQLFSGYIKAKKNRVCPIVEIVEEK